MSQAYVIDKAVTECIDYIETRKQQCNLIIGYQIVLLVVAMVCLYIFVHYFLWLPTQQPAADSLSSPAAGNLEASVVGASETAAREIDSANPSELLKDERDSTKGDASDKEVSGLSKSAINNELTAVSPVGSALANTMIIALTGLYAAAFAILMV